MMVSEESNSSKAKAKTTTTTTTTGGVADYFAILGVGERLVWKHTQKQQQSAACGDENNDNNANNNNNANEESPSSPEEEEEAALLEERFFREIVDVSIVTVFDDADADNIHTIAAQEGGQEQGQSSSSKPSSEASTTTQQQQQQPTAVPAVTSLVTEESSQGSSSKNIHALPSSPSHSEATTATTTLINAPHHHASSSQAQAQAQSANIISKQNGWNVIQKTLPSSVVNNINNSGALKDHPSASSHQVMDANLNWNTGLHGEVVTRAPHHQQQQQGQPHAPLKGLRHKMESTLIRHWQRVRIKSDNDDDDDDDDHDDDDHAAHRAKFYVAYKQRRQDNNRDDDRRSAITELELLYVRLHRSSLLQVGAQSSSVEQQQQQPGTQQQQPSLGIGQILGERYQSQAQHPTPTAKHHNDAAAAAKNDDDDDNNLVHLQDYLTLPDGFDEWVIPQDFARIRDPACILLQQAASSAESSSRTIIAPSTTTTTTVLFSHSDITSQLSGGGGGGDDDGSGVGVEAIETVSQCDNATTTLDPEQLRPQIVKMTALSAEQDDENGDDVVDEFEYIPVLALRRQGLDDEERYHEQDTAIVELAVSFVDQHDRPVLPADSSDEEVDDDEDDGTFRLLGKSKWSEACWTHNTDGNTSNVKRKRPRTFGAPVILSRRNIPYGFADTAFATRVLGRFPFENYKDLPLPEEELPMFCYPTGCRLHRARFSDAPLAEYYGFVVKNERGDSIHVSCVSFMEPLTSEKANQLAQMSEKRRQTSLPHRRFCEDREKRKRKMFDTHSTGSSDASTEADSNFLLTGFDDMTTFEKKTICLVSRYPFWTAFRKFLSHLHVLSGSSSELPLERYISHLLLSVPLPKPGGPSVIVPLPALNDPMVLTMPPEKDFPLVDLPFHRLVACLDVKTIVTIVLGLLALERKVIVMSTRPSLVLDVSELLKSLLFPFELCAPYVPRLTEPFKSSLDFPGALFVGIHKDGSPNGLAELVQRNPPEDSILVDLDTGKVDCDGDRYEVMRQAWDIIPDSARSVLVSELETLCRDASIVDGQEPLDSQFDSAFEVALPDAVEDFGISSSTREPLDDRAVRDAFLRFFCAVLGGYERYLVVPDADFLVSGDEWFDAQGFLASVPSERASYLNALVSTQLFQSFIQRRTEASDVHCLLFDECLAEFHSSPVPYGRLGGDVEAIPNTEGSQPQMLYSLLVDQSATLHTSSDQLTLMPNRSMDMSEANSSVNLSMSKASLSFADYSVKHGESAVSASGDFITAPSHIDLPPSKRYSYCKDGNPCFPHRMNAELFLPKEPESWLVEMTKAPNPLLARSERELEEANRRRRMATSYRGLQNQRRCLWQLPKLMGSHFLGAWLLCIPVQVSQENLTDDQQSRYLMRALGALRLMRSKQRIVPDEAAYRALMVACGRTRSDRRVELVKLFGLLRSDGIFPSAVTLGQYTRALAEGYSKRSGVMAQDDDYGLEVTESSSRIGRLSVSSMSQKASKELEISLCALDSSLLTLESHGRHWRHRNSGLPERQKKRSSNKTWLPVVFSSSIVPAISDNTKNGESENVLLLAMWSRTRGCRHCSYIPLEEEIQAGWDVVGGDNEIPGAVACPRCGSLIVPMLGYKEMSLDEAMSIEDAVCPSTTIADFGELPPQIGPTVNVENDDASYVAYISPAALRLSLEQYVEEYGEEVLARERLKQLDAEIYYNFYWYCCRFSLPLPLPVSASADQQQLAHYYAFAAWDRSVAERACCSAAKVLMPVVNSIIHPSESGDLDDYTDAPPDSFEEVPLLSRFNLQGFYSTVWDHADLSKILVTLVEACDKRDFKPVVEAVLGSNQRRKDLYEPTINDTGSEINSAVDLRLSSETGPASPSFEMDVYRTILYLAKYQCTTAFHAFFPATAKPCKGYHFWCAIGTPLPIFDRLLRDGVKRVKSSKTVVAPIHDISDIALGFRCVFGHLI